MVDHRRIKAKRLRFQRDRALEVLKRFTDDALRTVEYRSTLTDQPDGFSDGKSGDGDGGDVSDPTGNAVLKLVEGTGGVDPQQVSCERIDAAFGAMWRSLEEAERSWDVILNVSESIRGRQTTLGTCQACLRADVPNMGNDRIRSGYCPACFKAWCRTDEGSGRQDRLSFEMSRRQLHVVGEEPKGPKHARLQAEGAAG